MRNYKTEQDYRDEERDMLTNGVWITPIAPSAEYVSQLQLKSVNPIKAPHFVYDDGGRSLAGYRGDTGDCVTRAIAIAAELPYQEVYDAINELGKNERLSKRKHTKSSARTGVYKPTRRKFLEQLGWTWVPTMGIGTGCKVHLAPDELPMGRLIVSVSKHLTAVIDGVIHDTYDPSRNGWRCVYGYYIKMEG